MRKSLVVLQCVSLIAICSMFFGYLVSKAERGSSEKGAREAILTVAHFPDYVRGAFEEVKKSKNSNYIQENNYGYCGVNKVDKGFVDSNYILTSFFDDASNEAKVELMSINDGKVIHSWTPPENEIMNSFLDQRDFKNHPVTHMNFAAIHPLFFADGSIVFNIMYGPLVKLDKDSHIEWINGGCYHHSIEMDADGNIWACYNENEDKYDSLFQFKDKVFEKNAIVKISQDGKILFKKSVNDILIENHYAGLLYGAGSFEYDPVHLNDIQPALSTTKYWNKGDLLISLRNKSCIFLYRPDENRIVWLKQGDWINQHDVDFVDSTKIALFGDDVVRLLDEEINFPLRGHNDVYLIDLATDKVTTPYSKVFKDYKIYTRFEGRSEILDNGQLFIEETDHGRLFIANPDAALWIYTKCYSPNMMSAFAWCRYLYRNKVNLNSFNHLNT